MKKNKSRLSERPNKTLATVNFILLSVLVLSIGTNQYIISRINKDLGIKGGVLSASKTSQKFGQRSANRKLDLSGNVMNDAIQLAFAQGVPKVYGEELKLDFGQAQAGIYVMRQFDPGYGKEKKISLAGEDLNRYVKIGTKIACEYCCGAKGLVNAKGGPACGCAHSSAMRGLLAYLIQNYGGKYTDDELMRELARWKSVYFPKQMVKKLASQLQGLESFTPDTASLVLGVDLPEYEGGKGAPLPSEIKNLPGMVGGC